jgi:hypothetical protein
LGTGRRIPSATDVIVRFAVQAYFHNREIMVTLLAPAQEIFMHMKALHMKELQHEESGLT